MLAEWSHTTAFTPLIQRYSDYLYRDHPDAVREAKPVLSLWARWHFDLLLPPLIIALLLGVARARLLVARAYPG